MPMIRCQIYSQQVDYFHNTSPFKYIIFVVVAADVCVLLLFFYYSRKFIINPLSQPIPIIYGTQWLVQIGGFKP